MLFFHEITRELFYDKTRISLTIIAIAWGTFSIAIMLAIGEGLRLNFAHTMANAGDNLLTITPGITTNNYRGIHANTQLKFTKFDINTISSLPNVVKATPQYNFNAKLRYRDYDIPAHFQAITPEYAVIHKIQLGAKQRFISPFDLNKRTAVVVVGTMTAETLFAPQENPLGAIIYIDNHPFTVIGVMQKRPQMNATDMPDSKLNWIPSSTYELLNNPQQINAIAVAYKNIRLLSQTKNSIQKVMALNHKVDPDDSGIVNFFDLSKDQEEINKFFINMQIFLGLIGGFILLIAGVGIANVMYAAVARSTKQIGLQMALGATKQHILYHYITESLVVTTIGGVIGLVLTVIVIYLIRLIPMYGELVETIGKPEPVLSFFILAIVILVLGITGFVAGLFPALKAVKVDPVEALVYE